MKWLKPKLESLNNARTVAGLCTSGGSNLEDRCESGSIAYVGPCLAGGEVISIILNCRDGGSASMSCANGTTPGVSCTSGSNR